MTTGQGSGCRAMISSTSLDLPEHRRKLIEACNRLDVHPVAMEHLAADGRTATQMSIAMVDSADVYLLVLGWRYGFVPEGSDISLTEMEYERALQRYRSGELTDILVFTSHPRHPLAIDDVDEDRSRVAAFRARVEQAHVRAQFRSVDELGALAIESLARSVEKNRRSGAAPRLVPPPSRPEPFTAHPYTLLRTARVVGRSSEQALLDDWYRSGADGPSQLHIVAMGGMGKSALTWRWYSETVAARDSGLGGAIWWSFYESDAGYERFVTRSCAYLSGRAEEQIQRSELAEREDLLLSLLDRERFLIVLDGAERLLRAYATLDATYVHDDTLDQRTAHAVAPGEQVGDRDADDYHRRRRLREFTDHRAARLFNRMRLTRRSRILVSSRLFPSSLENDVAQPLPGCDVVFLHGMSSADAIELWREFGATGRDKDLAEVFEQLGNYPLAIRTLAGTVAQFRPAPGDLTRWRERNPDFLRTDEALRRSTRHVLRHALADLGPDELRVLRVVAGFRMPVDWRTLVDVAARVHVGAGDESVLVDCLEALENRGLIGWDRAANRYDLHPVVRLSTWNATPEDERRTIMAAVYRHHTRQLARDPDDRGAGRLTSQIESFYALGAMGRHQEAFDYFARELHERTLHTESLITVHLELLEQFFPDGLAEAPVLEDDRRRRRLHRWLTYAYMIAGEPGTAVGLTVGELRPSWLRRMKPYWREFYFALAECGRLREAEAALAMLHREKSEIRGPLSADLGVLPWYARLAATRGQAEEAHQCAMRYARLAHDIDIDRGVSFDTVIGRRFVRDQLLTAERLLDRGDVEAAAHPLDRVEKGVGDMGRTRERIRLLQLRGREAHLSGDRVVARQRLEEALLLARSHGVVALELACLIELARVERDDGRPVEALEHLRDVHDPARRGPYPIEEADARVLAAEIALDAGDQATAVAEARTAYETAWCDGPPYAYAKGLRGAKAVLARCGAAAPALRGYDQARFSPLPQFVVTAQGHIEVAADGADDDFSMRWFHVIEAVSADRRRSPPPPW